MMVAVKTLLKTKPQDFIPACGRKLFQHVGGCLTLVFLSAYQECVREQKPLGCEVAIVLNCAQMVTFGLDLEYGGRFSLVPASGLELHSELLGIGWCGLMFQLNAFPDSLQL